jgi:hypothetical protein
VISHFTAPTLISNEGGEGDGGEFHLFVGHFTELGDSDLLGVPGFLEILLMSHLIPLAAQNAINIAGRAAEEVRGIHHV